MKTWGKIDLSLIPDFNLLYLGKVGDMPTPFCTLLRQIKMSRLLKGVSSFQRWFLILCVHVIGTIHGVLIK